MAELTVRTRLKGFQLIERLLKVNSSTIGGSSRFQRAPLFLGLEAMAQLAALHARHLIQFERHAFLLKVIRCDLPAVAYLQGCFDFQANLLRHSSNAFAYGIKAQGPNQERDKLTGVLLIGTLTYDDQFEKEHLQGYYQSRFNQLNLTGNQKP